MAIITGSNRALPAEAASFVDKFEEYEKEILTEKSAFMNKVKKIKERQTDLLDDAKGKGWAKGVIKDTVKIRKKYREIAELMGEQEDDARVDVDALIKALGVLEDLPLGRAAIVDAETPKQKKDKQDAARTSAVVNAVKDSMTDEEVEANKKPATMSDEEWANAKPQGRA